MLRLRTFGGLGLEQPGNPNGSSGRRRLLALLTLLAVAGDRGMTRDRLAAYLWPDSDDDRARNSLSQALTALRRELGADVVIVDGAELRLNTQAIGSDVHDFGRLLEQGALADAVSVYGGPFLDGVFLKGSAALEQWIEQQRARYQRLCVDALEKLASAARAAGDRDAAVHWSRQRAEAVPLDGRATLALMEALAAAGDSTGALQHFRIHETLLRTELEANPDSDVQALADHLRARSGSAVRPGVGLEPRSSEAESARTRAALSSRGMWRIGIGIAAGTAALFFIMRQSTSLESTVAASTRNLGPPVTHAGAHATAEGRASASLDRLGVSRVVVGNITSALSSADSLYFDASISPDGNHLAYAGGSPGRMRIFVRPLTGSQSVLVSEGVVGNHRWPRWSPDGSRIVFQAATPGSIDARIYQVPAFGGSAELLVDGGAWPAFSRDGRLAYTYGGVWILGPRGGAAIRIDSTRNAVSPTWSPDGRRILFAADDQHYLGSSYGGISKNPVWIIDANGRHKRRLYAADALHAAPTWSPDGESVLFVSDRDGIHDVYRQRLDSDSLVDRLERVTTGAGVYTFTLSADGSRMAFSRLRQFDGSNIWVAALGDSLTPFTDVRQVTRGHQQIESFSVSHDGRWLAFGSDRDGDGYVHIYKVPLGGGVTRGTPIRLTHATADDFDPRWSPDDREVAFHRRTADNRDVYVVGADGRRETRVTTDTARNEYHPDWSPDGQRLVYTSISIGVGERYHVHTVARGADGRWSEPTEISRPNVTGVVARWSPVANDILLWADLRILSLDDGRLRSLLTRQQLGEIIPSSYWSGDARTVYFQSRDSNRVFSYWKYDLASARRTRLLTLSDSLLKGKQPYFDVHGTDLFFTLATTGSDVLVAALAWRR